MTIVYHLHLLNTQTPCTKSFDFIVILAIIAHLNKWTIVKMRLEKRIHKGTVFISSYLMLL